MDTNAMRRYETTTQDSSRDMRDTDAQLAGDLHAARRSLYDAEGLLSERDERELFAAYQAAQSPVVRQQLSERIVLANTRLVRKMAQNFAKNHKLHSLTRDDLEMEGIIGLMKAVERFDVSKGYKFSTYATWWVQQAMTRAVDGTDAMIRVANWRIEEVRREKRIAASPEAMEARLHAETPATAAKPKQIAHSGKGRRPEPRAPLPYVVSLDAPLDPYGDHPQESTLLALLADTLTSDQPVAASPAAATANSAVSEAQTIARLSDHAALYQALGHLDARERMVIELRYGLTDGVERTLEAVGQAMNALSRERIRQIEARALRVLRACLLETPEGDVLVSQLLEWRLAVVRRNHAHARTKPTAITSTLTSTLTTTLKTNSTPPLSTLVTTRRYA